MEFAAMEFAAMEFVKIKSQFNINNALEDNLLNILSYLSYHDLYVLYISLFNTSHNTLYKVLNSFLQQYTIDEFKIVRHNSRHSFNIKYYLCTVYNKLKWISFLKIKVNKLSIDIDCDDYISNDSILLNNIANLLFIIPYKSIYICGGIVIDDIIEIILINLTHALNNSALSNTLVELHLSDIPKIEEDYFKEWPVLNNIEAIKITSCIVPFDCSISDLLMRIPNVEYIHISNRTQLNWSNIIINNIELILPQLKHLTLENAFIDDALREIYCPNLTKFILINSYAIDGITRVFNMIKNLQMVGIYFDENTPNINITKLFNRLFNLN